MIVTQKTDMSGDAHGLLINYFQNKPKIRGLLDAFIEQVQDLEDGTYPFYTQFLVSAAIGSQLNAIGFIVGVDRAGRSDSEYRTAIYAQIAINTSRGTISDIITVYELLTGSTDTQVLEYFPGVIDIFGNVNIEWELDGDGADAFAFDGGIDGLGFGDVFDTSVGGTFAELVINDLTSLRSIMDSVLAGGVRLDNLGYFEDEGFAFEGSSHGLGFGDYYDSTVGGGFATIA